MTLFGHISRVMAHGHTFYYHKDEVAGEEKALKSSASN
jgi:hypothetical protein